MTVREIAIEGRGLTKSFGPNTVLSQVDLQVAFGEVHGLLGENGSGKSTLIKIFSGFHSPDSGTVRFSGDVIPTPVTAAKKAEYRIGFVHQHLGLVPSLTVAENLSLDAMAAPGAVGIWFGLRQARAIASHVLEQLEIDIDPGLSVSALPLIDRSRVAIARAALGVGLVEQPAAVHNRGISGKNRIGTGTLVLDEPTASLTRDEVLILFRLIRRLTRAGGAVLFVSHDLDEVIELTDRVTVLRDGVLVGEKEIAQTTKSELVDMIVGYHLEGYKHRASTSKTSSDEVVLEAVSLNSDQIHDFDLNVRSGEIVGLTGLLGSGFDSVPYLLAGAHRATGGRMRVFGESWIDFNRLNPREAMNRGLVLLPSKRGTEGAVLGLSVADNIQMPYDMLPSRWITRHSVVTRSLATMREFDVRPLSPDHLMGHLSGGNQQKAILGRCFSRDPRVVLLCNPTQGVDVGAREQIYAALRELCPGRAVVCASADHEELARLCHRVIVLARGRYQIEISGDDLTQSAITRACLQSEVDHVH